MASLAVSQIPVVLTPDGPLFESSAICKNFCEMKQVFALGRQRRLGM